MDLSTLAANCNYINNWTLDNCLNRTLCCELIDFLMLNHIPQFHFLSTIEQHLVHIGHRVYNSN